MSKNIIILSDGTGNQGGRGNGTNVWRLYNAIDLHGHETDAALTPQIAAHDDGVGTDDFKLFKQLGGITGWGISRNIRRLYEYLVLNYEPGDRIFLFGFSRGAFTVRSLSGLITRCGIIDRRRIGKGIASPREVSEAVKQAFKAYRKDQRRTRGPTSKLRTRLGLKPLPAIHGAAFRAAHCHPEAEIRCLGVWDTVGALGVPFATLRKVIDFFFSIDFHSHDLSPIVKNGFHALALDDERRTFHPTMWNERETEGIERKEQHVEQVWFSGAHSNVGGGYPKQGMAFVTLHWMMVKVQGVGLRFKTAAIAEARHAANVHDRLYDPRSGVAAYYRYLPRDVQRLSARNARGPAKIHRSVFDRIETATAGYSPGNIPSEFELVETEPQAEAREPERVVRAATDALAHPAGRSLLETTRLHIKVRQWMQVSYTVMTVALIVASFYSTTWVGDREVEGLLGTGIQKGWDFFVALVPWEAAETRLSSLGTFLALNPLWLVALVAVAVGFPFISGLIRANMQDRYSRVWCRFRTQVSEVRRTQTAKRVEVGTGRKGPAAPEPESREENASG